MEHTDHQIQSVHLVGLDLVCDLEAETVDPYFDLLLMTYLRKGKFYLVAHQQCFYAFLVLLVHLITDLEKSVLDLPELTNHLVQSDLEVISGIRICQMGPALVPYDL